MKKIKSITLASGNEDNWYWCCVCQISNNGAIRKRWTFNYETQESRKEYYQKHRELFRENNRSYYRKNKAKIYASNREWRKSHKEEWAKYQRTYEQTEKGKKVGRKKYTKRRGLGFIPLNAPFENSVGHHIDRNHIVFLPEKIHARFHHSLSDEASMEAINSIAMLYLPKQIAKNRKHSKKRILD